MNLQTSILTILSIVTLTPSFNKFLLHRTVGTWDKAQMTAIPNYLDSLADRWSIDVTKIRAEYLAARGPRKKQIAESLVLAKTTGDLKGTEVEYCGDTTTSGSEEGWLSAFQIWKLEGLPCVKDTQVTRVQCLMVLERRPHNNPLRAASG